MKLSKENAAYIRRVARKADDNTLGSLEYLIILLAGWGLASLLHMVYAFLSLSA